MTNDDRINLIEEARLRFEAEAKAINTVYELYGKRSSVPVVHANGNGSLQIHHAAIRPQCKALKIAQIIMSFPEPEFTYQSLREAVGDLVGKSAIGAYLDGFRKRGEVEVVSRGVTGKSGRAIFTYRATQKLADRYAVTQ